MLLSTRPLLRRGGLLLLLPLLGGCAAGTAARSAVARPPLGPGTDWVVGAAGEVGLCAPQDGATRICGWTGAGQARRWTGDVERVMREPAGQQPQRTPELRLSDGITVHLVRNRAGAVRPYQLVFSDGRQHRASGAGLTEADGADLLARLRDAVARAEP